MATLPPPVTDISPTVGYIKSGDTSPSSEDSKIRDMARSRKPQYACRGRYLVGTVGIVICVCLLAFLPSSQSSASLSRRFMKDDTEPLTEHTTTSESINNDSFSSLRGPLIRQNFPDPCVIFHEGITYAFATNNRRTRTDHIHVQVATSIDNSTWNVAAGLDALPVVAAWQTGKAVWAPDVKQLPTGEFLLYYTDSLNGDPNTHCIGAATSPQITGPYRPQEQPLICPHGGAIDPAGFYDRSSGRRYIVYKVDGNSLGNGGLCKNDIPPIKSTPIMLQEVNPNDGITFIGIPIQLLDRETGDGPLIEAPAMYLSTEGVYFLFFSADCYTSARYHTSYATSLSITGPYKRAATPLLCSGDGLNTEGPGGMDIIHHSYTTAETGISLYESNSSKHRQDSRIVLFHSRINQYNDPEMRELAFGNGHQKPIDDTHLPFVRGLYSGIATFKGRTVSLGGHQRDQNEG